MRGERERRQSRTRNAASARLPLAVTAPMLHRSIAARGNEIAQSQVTVIGTSNAGSPVTSPPRILQTAVRPVLDEMHCASGAGHAAQLAPRN